MVNAVPWAGAGHPELCLFLQESTWKSAAHSSSTAHGAVLACSPEDPPCSESSNPSQVTVREQEVVSQSSAKFSLNWCFQTSELWRFLPEPSASLTHSSPLGTAPVQHCSPKPTKPEEPRDSHRELPMLGWPRGSRTCWEQSWQQATHHGNAKDRHEMHQILTLCSVCSEFHLRFGWQDLPVKCWMPPALLLGASFLHVAAGV